MVEVEVTTVRQSVLHVVVDVVKHMVVVDEHRVVDVEVMTV